MKRQFLTLFLTLIILISVGGTVSIVGAESHVNPGQVLESPVVATSSYPVTREAQAPVMKMTAIDVGRGDALLLQFPNGKNMLVDGGGSYAAQHYVLPYLKHHHIDHLDAILATHEHWDHLDGLIYILKDKSIPVYLAYDSGFPFGRAETTSYEYQSIAAYDKQLKQQKIEHKELKAGDFIHVGSSKDPNLDVQIFVLSPSADLTKYLKRSHQFEKNKYEEFSSHTRCNENALVLRIGFGKVHFLLTGDTGKSKDKYGHGFADYVMMHDPVISNHLHADVLKLGHHGFEYDKAFYEKVNPQYVIQTFGPKLGPKVTDKPGCEGLNKKGIQNIGYFKGKLWSTCELGNIVVTTTGSKESIHITSDGKGVPKICCCNCEKSTQPKGKLETLQTSSQQNVLTTTTPLAIQQTPSTQAPYSTKIGVWTGYMGMPAMWLSDPVNNPVKRGTEVNLRIWIDASNGKCPCRPVNYYIDDAAAGGTWNSKPGGGDYCCGGLSGGTGGLILHGQDTAKFAPGWHTLKIDFPGDDMYAPSQWTGQFLVV